MIHEIIRATAIYASIMTVISAIIFAAYLEIYSWVTGITITSDDYGGWRPFIPKFALTATVFCGLVSSCSTIATIIGF